MSKHTPGPWAWRKFGWVYLLVADYGGRKVVLDAENLGQNETPAPMTRDAEDGCTLKQLTPDHPNARLIAAAPELLEALKGIFSKQNCVCKLNPLVGGPVPCETCQLGSLIAKAEAP